MMADLTREAVLAMSPDALGLTVAERILGLMVIRLVAPRAGPYGSNHATTKADVAFAERNVPGFDASKVVYEQELPRFASDMRAAWEVEAEMRQRGCGISIDVDPRGWTEVAFYDGDANCTPSVKCENSEVAAGICRAALLAVAVPEGAV